jgi:hypothetical protein
VSHFLFFKKAISNTERGWNNAIKDGQHLTTVPLLTWALFHLQRDDQKAQMLMRELTNVADPMHFRIDQGQM